MTDDFTEKRYIEMLDLASDRFTFQKISDSFTDEGTILWRHDIDFSPNRAVALARIEHDRALPATYYVQVSSPYYTVFEPEVADMLRTIAALGHEIGLHFDPSAYPDGSDLRGMLNLEARVLSEIIGVDINSFSLHNPTTYDASGFLSDTYEGFVNATAPSWRERFTYCSDSNGVWRFTPMMEVLSNPNIQSVYALTHPLWWQVESLLPRDRVKRCLYGRADMELEKYDAFLDTHQRPNVGKVLDTRYD